MNAFFYIALGAAFGASSRHGLSLILSHSVIPLGQIVSNILGSFVAGLIIVPLGNLSEEWRLFIVIGFLGSFTTMSAYSTAINRLLVEKQYLWGCVLWSTGAVFSILAAGLGLALSEIIFQKNSF